MFLFVVQSNLRAACIRFRYFSDFYLYRDSPRYIALIQLGFNSCSYLDVVSQNSIAAANSGSNIGSDRAVIYISTFYST